jgi:hypothetical protein
MAVSNIEKFDDIAGRILAELYERFPVATVLSTEDFMDSGTHWDDTLGMEVLDDDGTFFISTATWLINAGYLSGSPFQKLFIENAVLTAKGLEVLKAIPDSLKGGASIGERLADAAKEGGKETMRGLVTEALGLGARLISPLVGLTS